jgi:N-acetylglutamate synthase-like GNAT family acetyltransferase
MNLRKATQEDKKAILKLVGLLYIEGIPGFVWSEEFVDRQIKSGEYYLAETDGGEAAGVISFRKRADRMYIETLAVDEKRRSEGIGTHLITFAKNFTKEKGLSTLRACSFIEYDKVDFYLKQGFALLDVLGNYGGHKFYRFHMEV